MSEETFALRSVLGKFATGVTVITSGREAPCGMTANSFTSVSLDPPLVLVCVTRSAAIYKTILDTGSFAISILSADQAHLGQYFADHSRPRGETEFRAVDWTPGPRTGAPVLHGSLAWLECELANSHDGGDHEIFLGSVLASGHGPEYDALLYFRGGFHQPPSVRGRPADPVDAGGVQVVSRQGEGGVNSGAIGDDDNAAGAPHGRRSAPPAICGTSPRSSESREPA